MNNKRTLILSLVGLLSSSSLAIPLEAQKRAPKRQNEVEKIRSEIKTAETKDLPTTLLSLSGQMIALGEKKQDISLVIEGLELKRKSLNSLRRFDAPDVYQALARAGQYTWLKEVDRFALDLYALNLYHEASLALRWDRDRNQQSDSGQDSIVPTRWSKEQYTERLEALLGRMKPYALEQGAIQGEYMLLGSEKRQKLSPAHALYISVGKSDLAQRFALVPSLSAFLSEYRKRTKEESERFWVDFALYELGVDGQPLKERIQAQSQLVETYQHLADVLPYVHQLASLMNTEGDTKGAVALLDRFILRSSSARTEEGADLRELRKHLLQPAIYIRQGSEHLIAHRDLSLKFTYRHLERVRAKVYKLPSVYDPDRLEAVDSVMLSGLSPIAEEDFPLEDGDRWGYRDGEVSITLPHTGLYHIVFEPIALRRAEGEQSSEAVGVQVTDKFVISLRHGDAQQYRWLDARTGQPLGNLEVEVREATMSDGSYYDDEGRRIWSKPRGLRTSSDGLMNFSGSQQQIFWLRSTDESDPYSFVRYTSFGNATSEHQPSSETKAQVYTDRSLYLPGQRVQIAGTLAQIFTASERNRVLASREVVVEVFAPQGGKAFHTERIQTDSFGRFHSSFDVPKTGLLGNARVSVRLIGDEEGGSSRHVGQVYFEIAEYKRPTFELEMTKPQLGYTLGDTIDVATEVRLFSGGALSDAKLSYEVYHSSHSLWRMPSYRSETLVHSQKLKSDANGEATLRLPLTLPKEMQVEQRKYPDYNIYRIVLRATAPSGEQQTKTLTLHVGNEFGGLSLELPEFVEQSTLKSLKPLRFVATSFDGDTLQRSVHYELYSSDSTRLRSGVIDSNSPLSLASLLGQSSLGRYRVRYFVKGDSSHLVEGFKDFTLYSSKTGQIDAGTTPVVLFARDPEFELGKPVDLLYSSALENSYVFYSVHADGKPLSSGMVRPQANRLERMTLPLRGDTIEELSAYFYTVRQGRLYSKRLTLNRKQDEKKLELRWETFRDRARAGGKETWRLRILKDGKPTSSALSAWMYDASLEDIAQYQIGELPDRLRHYYTKPEIWEVFHDPSAKNLDKTDDTGDETSVYAMTKGSAPMELRMAGAKMAMSADIAPMALGSNMEGSRDGGSDIARTNFSETAFFYPTLQTDRQGRVSWTFTLPESLTRWKLHLQAHTEDLYKGYLTSNIETYKELSVRPLMPRFALSGDSLSIATSIRNASPQAQQGTFVFAVIDPLSGQTLKEESKTFDLASGASSVVESAFVAPKGLSSVVIRTTAEGRKFSDGEQHLLKILPLERENMRTKALTLKGKTNYTLPSNAFVPQGLPKGVSGQLSISFEANPFYLTLGSLPWLGEEVSECSIDLSSALYAQGVAKRIKQDTQLMSWLGSQISKDSASWGRDTHLKGKSAETPWAERLEADGSKARLSQLHAYLLSDLDERARDLSTRLARLQHASGAWAWFAGMRPHGQTHQTVLSNLVHLEQIDKDLPQSLKTMMDNGWRVEHRNAKTRLEELEKQEQKLGGSPLVLSSDLVHYTYLLGLSPRANKLGDEATIKRVHERLRRDAHRLSLEDKAKASIALARIDKPLAMELVRSLKEYLTLGEDGELFVSADRPAGLAWYSYSFSSTVRVLEAICMLDPSDIQTIEGIKQWILQQKRGQSWGSSLATADAIYALALGGAVEHPNDMSIALVSKDSENKEARGDRPSLTQEISKGTMPSILKVESKSAQTLWGVSSVRYTAPLTAELVSGEGLKIERRYYIRTIKDGKPYLRLAQSGDELKVGDRMVVQIYIKLGQAMDFVRLSDPRLGFAEPIEQVASYKWGAGVGYYVEPRDEETNFYFDTLGAGEYRLEYEQAVVRSGKFHMPQAYIQSVYAPEYSGGTGYSGEALVLPAVKK